MARRAGVSTGTVSAVLNGRDGVAVLNGRDGVAAATLLRVQEAIADLGYASGAIDGPTAPHWRRGGFATWLFQSVVTGCIRRRRRSRDGRCRCWPIRGRRCRSGAAMRRAAPSAAGRRSRRG
ncbi:LacI family DNA-binding transcriptional regulator [Dactylosporangium sp. AC04546]|uniref:LacI family DNA-binding transcriptional regulator n=1 Tax=Dactylosporangium sp. AC04546 TaxID=2862460 RepID=UPI0027E119DA|nr:LacI family DNA-binding transcriptional regulator [Dactylosporangium sp. AC04546]WVK86777.1 LacI family DNA-binding transcriptional regulator [Dactylosporangium sp. AC04546]